MKKLAIVGSHPATRDQAPWDDAEYEIWVFNEAPMAKWCKRWDVCVQIHPREIYQSENNWIDKGYWAWLQQEHGERVIYLHEKDERVPNSETYPLDEIIERVPGGRLRWIKSGPAYGLALALLKGYKTIGFWGMDMASNTEYSYQLPNWQFWIGVAMGMEVEIVKLSNEAYFGGRLYGFEGEVQLPVEWFEAQALEAKDSFEKSDKALKMAKQRLGEVLLERKPERFKGYLKITEDAAIACGNAAGLEGEAKHYLAKSDPVSRQEFERRSAVAQIGGQEQLQEMYHLGGTLEYVYVVYVSTGNYEALKQVREYIEQKIKAAYDCGARDGAFKLNQSAMREYDERVQMAGGQRSVQAVMG